MSAAAPNANHNSRGIAEMSTAGLNLNIFALFQLDGCNRPTLAADHGRALIKKRRDEPAKGMIYPIRTCRAPAHKHPAIFARPITLTDNAVFAHGRLRLCK